MQAWKKKQRGFSLIEVIVVSSLLLIVFGGLFAGFEFTLNLVAQSRAKLTALSLMTDRVEYIKSLPYTAVGTVAGIPSGEIPQTRSVQLNGISFTERVLIQFVDDPADGSGASDTNGIVSDYKTVTVEYTWDVYNRPNSVRLVTTVVPRSIETDAGGGTLRVNVRDVVAAPVAGATVRLVNTTLGTSIDITRLSGAGGEALFTGVPEGAGYEVFVSKAGYSSDQTRVATSTLSDPATLPAAVGEANVSTLNFIIDRLSSLQLRFIENSATSSVVESFADMSGVTDVSNATTTADRLVLSGTPGSYPMSGQVFLTAINPSPNLGWGLAHIEAVLPSKTDYIVRFYTAPDTDEIIPDSVLPGNAAGFTASPIDLTTIRAIDYPTLYAQIMLTSADSAVTPEVDSFTVEYRSDGDVLSGLDVELEGVRTIGSNAGVSVLANATTSTTNAQGIVSWNALPYDLYQMSYSSAKSVVEICPYDALNVVPDTAVSADIEVAAVLGSSLRVVALADDAPLVGAVATVTNGTVTRTAVTSWCGQVFFAGLTDGDYTVTVEAAGYSDETTGVTISGDTVTTMSLSL